MQYPSARWLDRDATRYSSNRASTLSQPCPSKDAFLIDWRSLKLFSFRKRVVLTPSHWSIFMMRSATSGFLTYAEGAMHHSHRVLQNLSLMWRTHGTINAISVVVHGAWCQTHPWWVLGKARSMSSESVSRVWLTWLNLILQQGHAKGHCSVPSMLRGGRCALTRMVLIVLGVEGSSEARFVRETWHQRHMSWWAKFPERPHFKTRYLRSPPSHTVKNVPLDVLPDFKVGRFFLF